MEIVGFQQRNGLWVNTFNADFVKNATAYGAGQTLVTAKQCPASILRMVLESTAQSGTNPVVDVNMLTSKDGVNGWRQIGGFTQQTGIGKAFKAVVAAGTTPPTVTLSGTANREINFRMECTTLGARATAVVRYSIDGGYTWTEAVTTAATIAVLDAANASADTGVVINYANATAAVDNVWTAVHSGFQSKVFSGCDRFVRPTIYVGGTSTPIVTLTLTGEAL